ncbi:cache domain-containing protein [Methanoplanus limicola]|uniref:Putative cache sensor protein n=1 Tax=Methanoplanus limicola DSM 2279 TaxID=937775 RepID=H1Z2K1_9EURY|nr:cache domain-containing protein [Methanoplanus limicola]EHQ35527.1 putative cache sensor protein [Methanoplanus limicola DSM 2279]
MKKYSIISVLLILAIITAFAGCTGEESDTQTNGINTANDTKTENAMESVAEELTKSINAGLEEINSGLSGNSAALSEAGLTGDSAEKILSENLLSYPWAVSSLIISKEGVVLTAMPKNYADVAGEDLSWQSQVQTANREQIPIVSDVFTMAEGFTGISQSSPVFSESGEYLGYTDITYKPDTFLARQIIPVIKNTPYDIWVAQTDGTLIYDTKEEEIGNNLMTDTMYSNPDLQTVLKRILKEPSGTAEYTFSDKNWNKNVTKTASWKTAGINGAEWRVVVTYSGNENEGEAAAEPVNIPETTDSRYENLKAFVDDAAAYAKEHGKEAALNEFNNVNGSFISKELYIFAYETDGTVIALPYQKELLGTDRAEITDANGVEFIRAAIDTAEKGGGSLYYIYPNPEDNYKEEFKLSYVMPVDDEWFVGAGIYLPEIPAVFNEKEIDELVKRVKSARDYAQANDKEEAIADFNDLNGTFADGANYIFAYEYDGATLALPFQPELIGTNRLEFSDTYGVEIIRWEISAAKRGGGFVYAEYFNPETGDSGLKLCYVTPVNDEWLVGSGIYTKSI